MVSVESSAQIVARSLGVFPGFPQLQTSPDAEVLGGSETRTMTADACKVEPKIRSSRSLTRATSPGAMARNHQRSCPRIEALRHSALFPSAPPRKQGVTNST